MTAWICLLAVLGIFGVSLAVLSQLPDEPLGPAGLHGDASAARRPVRIVSMSPSITETLFALGLGDRVAGVTRFCDYPPEAESLPEVGGYFDPSYEAIIALRPDLVILLPDHEQIARSLEEIGVATLTVDHIRVQGILDSILAIGSACGAEERAEALVSRLEKRIDAVRSAVAGRGRPKVLVAVGRDVFSGTLEELFIAGSSGWYTEMIELAGGENAYRGDMAFPSISAEGLLKLDPEVVVEMLGDMPGESVDRELALRAWQDLRQIRAVRSGRVHVFDEDYIVVPGPRFVRILERLARVLHPDAPWPTSRPADREEGP